MPVVTLYSTEWSFIVYSAPSPPHDRLQLELNIKSCTNSKRSKYFLIFDQELE